ncbi:MAG: hypothetical protein E7337_08580 [Clostridiales bacterium]|nr:hypothetical protein [Clostridiales bacterium]
MKRTQARNRRARERRLSRILMCVFAVVLLVGLISQITMLACISGQQKKVQAVEKQLRELDATADNLNLCLNQFKSIDRITLRAGQLGMEQPDETQIRVVSLPNTIISTSTQSVENIDAEEIFN